MYLTRKLLYLSDAKVKKGIFVGQKIHELLKDAFMEGNEKAARKAFRSVDNFLGNSRVGKVNDS